MFGKTGVFCDGLMFAMVTQDMLYFRVDDLNSAAFEEARSSPPLNYEKKGGTAIEVLLVVERLLRAAKTPDEYNGAMTSAINHFKRKSDRSIPSRGHKKFAQELERRLMRKAA